MALGWWERSSVGEKTGTWPVNPSAVVLAKAGICTIRLRTTDRRNMSRPTDADSKQDQQPSPADPGKVCPLCSLSAEGTRRIPDSPRRICCVAYRNNKLRG